MLCQGRFEGKQRWPLLIFNRPADSFDQARTSANRGHTLNSQGQGRGYINGFYYVNINLVTPGRSVDLRRAPG
jgi:hypothetical protein